MGLLLSGVGAMGKMVSWQPVELVFRGAGEDLFSHGICPEKLWEQAPVATGYNPG